MIQAMMLVFGSFVSGRLACALAGHAGRPRWEKEPSQGWRRLAAVMLSVRFLRHFPKKIDPGRATANFAGHPARVQSNTLNSTRLWLAWEMRG
jgi:hypothetical protein